VTFSAVSVLIQFVVRCQYDQLVLVLNLVADEFLDIFRSNSNYGSLVTLCKFSKTHWRIAE